MKSPLVVTDMELIASQAVKIIFLLILITGLVINGYRIVAKNNSLSRKGLNFFICIALIAISFFVIRQIDIDGNLLKNGKYTIGHTTGYCEAFAMGEAIEFEYTIGQYHYTNCNTYYPFPKDSIKVPGGSYFVRYSEKYPSKGRMDFRRPQNENQIEYKHKL